MLPIATCSAAAAASAALSISLMRWWRPCSEPGKQQADAFVLLLICLRDKRACVFDVSLSSWVVARLECMALPPIVSGVVCGLLSAACWLRPKIAYCLFLLNCCPRKTQEKARNKCKGSSRRNWPKLRKSQKRTQRQSDAVSVFALRAFL